LISCKQSKRKTEKRNATFSFSFKNENAKKKDNIVLKPKPSDYKTYCDSNPETKILEITLYTTKQIQKWLETIKSSKKFVFLFFYK
jgi:hypothetical protein